MVDACGEIVRERFARNLSKEWGEETCVVSSDTPEQKKPNEDPFSE